MSYNFVPRICDLGRLIIGRKCGIYTESSLIEIFYSEGKTVNNFMSIFSGILKGYYFDNISSNKEALIDETVEAAKTYLPDYKSSHIDIDFPWTAFSYIEEKLSQKQF